MKDEGSVLVIACGNSTVRLALVEGGAVSRRSVLPHRGNVADDALAAELMAVIAGMRSSTPAKGGDAPPLPAVLCSVVPELALMAEDACYELDLPLRRVRAADVTWFDLRYDPPEALGEDRLCCLIALREIYGYPSMAVDFGTATTVNVLDERGNFAGGWIAPGIGTSFAALAVSTALLPDARDGGEPPLLGSTTRDSIRAGILTQGRLGMGGLLGELRGRFGRAIPVVATGGAAAVHHAALLPGSVLDEDLVLLGAAVFCRRA